jgi:Lipid A 3-O-deacylase (PagL)
LFPHGVPRLRTAFLIQAVLLVATLASIPAAAQTRSSEANPFFARKNTFSIFGGYSNDSSRILMGNAENRKLLEFGIAYSRRLFVDRIVNWQYNGELLPVALESDPLLLEIIHQTEPTVETFTFNEGTEDIACTPRSSSYSFVNPNGVTYAGTQTLLCSGRQWNIGEAISPIGFQWNFLPRRRLQPFLIGHGGYMYSTKPIPIPQAGSFNFTFDLGAGVELYRGETHSVRAEYRYHHISNHGTAMENPGIDNGLFQLTYSFGR